jgi:hypothetical protein
MSGSLQIMFQYMRNATEEDGKKVSLDVKLLSGNTS